MAFARIGDSDLIASVAGISMEKHASVSIVCYLFIYDPIVVEI